VDPRERAEAELRRALEAKHKQQVKLIDIHMRVPEATWFLLRHFALEEGLTVAQYLMSKGMAAGLSQVQYNGPKPRALPWTASLMLGRNGHGQRKGERERTPDYSSTMQEFILRSFGKVIPNFESAGRTKKYQGKQQTAAFDRLNEQQMKSADSAIDETEAILKRMNTGDDE
jgi:hypothetical protein